MEEDNLDVLHKQLLTCPVCLDDFQDDTHTYLLPCLHSLCETCTPKMVKNGILSCPICRMEHHSVSFPTDNTTRDLADYVVVKKSTKILCEGKGCVDSNIASHRCRPCGEFLCDECVSAHHRTTLTRNHAMIPMEELRDATDLNMFCHPQTCQIHEGKPLELYCKREECQKPVCVTCAFVHHKTNECHDLVDINEIAKDRQLEISTMIQTVKEKSQAISVLSKKIIEEKKEVKMHEEYVYNEIDAVIDTLQQQLQRTKENLMEKVAKQVKQKCENLEKQESELKVLASNIKHAVLYSDNVVRHSSVPAFLQVDRTIADRLQNLMLEEFDKEPWEMAAFGLECQGVNGEVQNALTQTMHVWSSSIYGPNTKILQPNIAVIGHEVVFAITMTTSDDQPIMENVHFQAVITDTRGNMSKVKVKESGMHNGNFAVTYTPTADGVYTLDLKMQKRTFATHTFTVGDDEKRTFATHTFTVGDCVLSGTEKTEKEVESTMVKQPVIRPPFPPQVFTQNADVFATLPPFREIRFILDRDTAHKEVTLSEDGTTFYNTQQGAVSKMSIQRPNRHKKFKGARGTHVFTQPGRYFYEVILEMKVVAPLQQNNIAFEIGIARQASIDNKKYIEGQPFAWSVIGAQHPACNSVCIHVVRDRKILLHKSLVKNEVDQYCRIVLGFLLDTNNGTWEIFNCEDGQKLCVVEDVDCKEALFPVVSGYNAAQIQVTAIFVTGHENLPADM